LPKKSTRTWLPSLRVHSTTPLPLTCVASVQARFDSAQKAYAI